MNLTQKFGYASFYLVFYLSLTIFLHHILRQCLQRIYIQHCNRKVSRESCNFSCLGNLPVWPFPHLYMRFREDIGYIRYPDYRSNNLADILFSQNKLDFCIQIRLDSSNKYCCFLIVAGPVSIVYSIVPGAEGTVQSPFLNQFLYNAYNNSIYGK